jgi:hypothetical protein
MALKDFLFDLSTNPRAMARFRRDSRRALDEAGLSEDERHAVIQGDPKTLKSMLGQVASSTPMQPGPSPTPPPELEVEPPEPIELNPGPPPEPVQIEVIEPPPELDIDESTNVAEITCASRQPESWT